MHQQDFEYFDGDVRCVGHLVYDDNQSGQRPLVLVAPAFEGRNQLSIDKATELAKLGYAALAIDMYGDAQVGEGIEASMALMMPFFQDRALLRQRVLAAFNAAKTIDVVDVNKIAGIGFCFGGMCVLDLARAGADVKAVVSFHGVFAAPEGIPNETIKAKVQLLHGHKDPQVKPDQAEAIAKELDEAGVDWQLTFYGNAEHAFTDPNANEPEMGRKYDPLITKRAWQAMENFLAEVFA